ncbi:hypothetical protein MTO96_036002, partial [Rhipicephalus appendiculatus]
SRAVGVKKDAMELDRKAVLKSALGEDDVVLKAFDCRLRFQDSGLQ